jgi:hypothetical protein
VAIDRVLVATVFLMVLVKRVHCRVHTGLTDHGIQFAVAR